MHIINITVRNKVAVNPAQERYVRMGGFLIDAKGEAYENIVLHAGSVPGRVGGGLNDPRGANA
jgi:hypothetical protein